jgi:fumarate hydratase subunit beta
MIKKIQTPINIDALLDLKVGDNIQLTGIVYAARDAAHKKMIDLINSEKSLPFDISGQAIYYVGPCPEKPGEVIGSAGPTTSGRMDAYTPTLLDLGLKVMIGKGLRSDIVIQSMVKNKAVYLGAIGGAGALIAQKIKKQEIIAFPELGAEALRKMYVEDLPLTVIIDSEGNNLYIKGVEKYRR